ASRRKVQEWSAAPKPRAAHLSSVSLWAGSAHRKRSPRSPFISLPMNRRSRPARPMSSTAGSPFENDRRHPMKLLPYGPSGQEKPGMLDRDGKIRDLSGMVRDIDGEALAPASLDRLRRVDPASLPLAPGNPRLGPCVARASKIVAIGLNYRAHAAETGAAI